MEPRHSCIPAHARPALLTSLHFIVDAWRGYVKMHLGAVAVLFVILVLTGRLFSVWGLILLASVLLYLALWLLEKQIEGSRQE